RIFSEIRSGKVDISRLEESDLLDLISSLNLDAEFMKEILKHAEKAGDRRSYFDKVLSSILKNEVVDLEAEGDYSFPESVSISQAIHQGKWEFLEKSLENNMDGIRQALLDESLRRKIALEAPHKLLLYLLKKLLPEQAMLVGTLAEKGGRDAMKYMLYRFMEWPLPTERDLRFLLHRLVANRDIAPSRKREQETRVKRHMLEEMLVANAGLVIAAPYFPRLFDMLGLTVDSAFRDEEAADRAVHLLQFAVDENCEHPEFLLPLNKILCGLDRPIVRSIVPSDREKETVEGMLKAIIQNWTIIGNTSVAGLRESFLQRPGRLMLKGEEWHLRVEKRGIDVLVDRIPWSFSLIKHPWMPRPLFVEWK
ncbi:MAG: hypothetical protein HKL98_05930, partial [Burkholderiales bacterium]|nr:hypothetical protein [Burkholderiales bacterium]